MDLTSPLRSLIPSLDSAVLEVLARTESGLGVSRIARLASRGSRQGLALAVDRLVEHGLVLADPANHGYLYRLNRDHLLVPALLAATSVRSTVLERLRGAFAQLEPAPVHAALFGSFARGEGGPGSDIDLLLVVADDQVDDERLFAQVRALSEQVWGWTGNRAEVLVLGEDGCAAATRAGEPLVGALVEESIWLAGTRPLTELFA